VRFERDARAKRFYFEKCVEQEGAEGIPLILTIDRSLQFFSFEELKKTIQDYQAQSGAVLIMNPDNGQILSMVNYPTFDANQKSIPTLDVTKNIIVTECFELGSVMKSMCALAALEEGVVSYDELIDCQGKSAYIDGLCVTNWKSVGIVPFCDVIKNSSNVGVAKVAKRLGPKLYTHLRRLGFGYKTGIMFPGERAGFVNAPEKWSRFSVLVMSFGYEAMASLLQLGRAFCVIANGGYLITPTLVLEQNQKKKIKKREKLYKDQTLVVMKNILEKIGDRYKIDGYRVMGKTGTARCVIDGQYSKKEHVYTFAGIVERGRYRRVIVTFIKRPARASLWAAEVAAPLFQHVAERMVLYEDTGTRQLSRY
jgi:cell division protein FtsI (penicillin-binding protein 3)